MAKTRTLKNMTSAQADVVVEQFKAAGGTNVTKTRQLDGKYTVTGTFP